MNRLFTLLFLAAAACTVARAQSPQPQPQPQAAAEAHGLAVVKFGWERQSPRQRGSDYFGRVNDNPDETSAHSVRNGLRSQGTRRAVFQVEANRAERTPGVSESGAARQTAGSESPRYAFLYKATFQNGAAKAVSSIDWDYVFRDPATREELGRHRFISQKKVAPGQKKECSFLVLDPPSRKVRAGSAGKDERAGVEGSVVVVRVVYEDGTVWRRR
jgi:hypothetical protein